MRCILNLEELLERLPLSSLVMVARDAGFDAGIAHRREDLMRTIAQGEPLPANLIEVIRRRVHQFVENHWNTLEKLMDPVCADCHRNGQQKCWDTRALGDYILNLPLIEIEEEET